MLKVIKLISRGKSITEIREVCPSHFKIYCFMCKCLFVLWKPVWKCKEIIRKNDHILDGKKMLNHLPIFIIIFSCIKF